MAADSKFEEWKHRASLQQSNYLEVYKSALEASQTALRAITLINGGAAVALLAFLGNVLAKHDPGDVHVSIAGMRWAMMVFVIGVFSAALASALRYTVQFSSAMSFRWELVAEHERDIAPPDCASRRALYWKSAGAVMTWLAFLAGFASLGAFVWGGIVCYRAIW